MAAPVTAGDPPTARVGRVLAGRYALGRHIASGGMAAVWEATDDVLGRPVAVKVLHPHLAADPSFLARFRIEARAAARLSQASVVAIFDTVSEPGCEAIVMEFVDGMTLRAFLDDHGAMSVIDAVSLIDQVAQALEAAHDAGIVHRDIKPGNILLCPDRRVKVTDFGIAKAAEETEHITDGALLGTAKYLAPEQVAGESVDARADLYSLGIVLYETLTGTPPFEADTPTATALARLHHDPPSVELRRPDLPPGLAATVATALARDPEGRFSSATAFRTALASAIVPPPPPLDTTVPMPPPTAQGDPSPPTTPHPTQPASSPGLAPAVVPGHDHLRAAVVAVVVLATLVLAIALLAATTIGRDLYDQVSDAFSTTFDADDSSPAPTTAGPSDAPAAAPDAVSEPSTVDDADSDPISVLEVIDFDPEGDGTEYPELASLAADGRAATRWHSERYDSRQLGNLKQGVGLVVALDDERPLQSLTVTSPTRGWAARVFVADGAAADLGGWGEPVDGRVDVDGSARFDLRGVVGSHVLVWVTDLGDELPRPRIEIGELAVS